MKRCGVEGCENPATSGSLCFDHRLSVLGNQLGRGLTELLGGLQEAFTKVAAEFNFTGALSELIAQLPESDERCRFHARCLEALEQYYEEISEALAGEEDPREQQG